MDDWEEEAEPVIPVLKKDLPSNPWADEDKDENDVKESWEDEDEAEPVIPVLKKDLPSNPWADEDKDENDVKESWEDEDEEPTPAPAPAPAPAETSTKKAAKKFSSVEKGKSVEVAKPDEVLDPLAEKLHQQRYSAGLDLEDMRNWGTGVLESDDGFQIEDEIKEMVCLPPFRDMIPPHHIHKNFIEPSLCMLKPGKTLEHAELVYRRRAYQPRKRQPKPYKQVFTDGGYTKGKKATYAAVAIDENGRCDGVKYGRTEDITPRCLIHELIGNKNGLELARELSYEYLHLLMDNAEAKDLIEELIQAGPTNKRAASEEEKRAKIEFKELLQSVQVEPDWKWKQALKVIAKDKRFGVLQTTFERQLAFSEYIKERKIVKAREDFLEMLNESEDLRVSTSWPKAMSLFKDDKRFQDVPQSEQVEIFNGFMLDLTNKLYEDEDEGWTPVISQKGKKMTQRRADNARKLLKKLQIRDDIERVKAEVLDQIRDLIFTHWVKNGVVKIVVHSVYREGNFLPDTLTHVPINHYAPVMKLRTDPDFSTNLICYFLYRNLFSYYIRYSDHYKFVRDKMDALKDNDESD